LAETFFTLVHIKIFENFDLGLDIIGNYDCIVKCESTVLELKFLHESIVSYTLKIFTVESETHSQIDWQLIFVHCA